MAGGTWVDYYGARNVHDGEYDISECRIIAFLVPLLLFRGYYHVFDWDRIQGSERQERIRRFGQEFLGWARLPRNEQGEIVWEDVSLAEIAASESPPGIPLKRSFSLMMMAIFYWFLRWSGCVGAMAVVVTYASCTMQRPIDTGDRMILAIFWGLFALFVLGLPLYRWLRKPSARQRRIRTLVARRLGPFSDPSDWLSRIGERVLSEYNLQSVDPDKLAYEAELLLVARNYEDALVVTRLGLSLARKGKPDRSLFRRLETLTDRCLEEESMTRQAADY